MNAISNVFAEEDELPSGTSLKQGHFTILRAIHRGGFGVAYLATDQSGNKVVIKECFPDAYCRREGIKVVPANGSKREDFQAIQRQFQAEARVLASFDHPNIIGIRNIFDENGTSYMVLEYIEGRDLTDLMSNHQNLTAEQIADILCETLKTLAYVHERGYLHGDISPDNIIITPDLKPYLIDFGTARPMIPEDVLATPVIRAVKDGYSPQELYIAGGKIGSYSDLYSLAASFYQVIAGKRPVGAQDRLKAVARQKPDPYEALASITSEFPDSFCQALDTALAAFPRKRLQAAEDWLDVIAIKRPEDEMLNLLHAHTHSPKGTGIYRNPGE